MPFRTKKITPKYAFKNTEILRLSDIGFESNVGALEQIDVLDEDGCKLESVLSKRSRPNEKESDAESRMKKVTESVDLQTNEINIIQPLTQTFELSNQLEQLERILSNANNENEDATSVDYEYPVKSFSRPSCDSILEDARSSIAAQLPDESDDVGSIEQTFANNLDVCQKSCDDEIDMNSIKTIFNEVTGVDLDKQRCVIL
jgi:hypothetical protein